MAKIAIFAGHGGSDIGAAANGFREKDLNLAVSNQASNILRSLGYTVINNRTTDVDRSITRDANLANENHVDAVVEIHMNSNFGTPGTGTEAFVSIRDTGRARAIANAILQRIAGLGYVNRGVKTQINSAGQDALGILRLTNMPAVLLELAFINNPQDMARFNVGAMASAVASGIRDIIPVSSGGSGLPAYPGTPLRVGARGESVRQVQRCLNNVGTRHPSIQRVTEDGMFGPRTLDAVTTFQRLFALVPDGVIGLMTWNRLAQECSLGGGSMPSYPGTALRIGDRGEAVRQVQRCLNVVGARHPSIQRLTEDGIFGPRMLDAVTAFQRLFGFNPDGVVGPLTWAALTRECGAAFSVRGMDGSAVENALPVVRTGDGETDSAAPHPNNLLMFLILFYLLQINAG